MTPKRNPASTVTAREEAQALRRERDLLAAVLDTAGALVVVFDRQGHIVRFNHACEMTTGYSFAEVRGKPLWNLLLVPEELKPVRAVFDHLRAGQFPNTFENYWLARDGSRRLIAWSNTALLGADGTVEYVIGTGIDVTERQQAEESLRRARDELELRVSERTGELQRANELLAALHETTLSLMSRLDISELLAAIVERALALIGAAFGFVYLVEPDSDEMEAKVGTGLYAKHVGQHMKREEGLVGHVWELGRPVAVEDYRYWAGRSPRFDADPVGPVAGVPLTSGGQVVGVLGLGRLVPSPPFRQDEIDTIGRFAQLASVALDNARLYSSVQQQLADLQRAQEALQQRLTLEQLITNISTEFVNLGPSDIDAGIEHALQTIGQFTGVDRSYVFQFSGDGTRLDNTHEWCAAGIESFIDSLKDMPRAAFPWFLKLLERFETVAVPRVAEMPPEASSERSECQREGIQSIILVPLAYRGVLVGFLGFDAVRAQRSWGDDTIALLKMAAGIITNALEHRRAQAIQAGQRQFLELLATGGDFRTTLHTLIALIENQWPGMLGLVLLLDEDGKHLHIGASVSLPQDYVQSIEGLEIGPMVGSCGTACYRRERVIVEDTATDPRWDGLRDLALQYGLRACWSEPVLAVDGQVLGTFAMYYRQPRAPTEAELRTIELGAHLVGVAIQHERAERALRESEGKFRTIVEYANMGIAIVQRARFRLMNPHFAAMLGYTAEEMLGKEFMPYCAPQERERIVDYYTRRARGEPVPARYTTVMLHKSGSYVYVEVSAGIIPYAGQQATFVFLRDITEEKQAKQALEEAYRTLEQRVEERTKELAALNSIAAVVSRSLGLNEIMSSALDKTLEVMGLTIGAAYRLVGKPGDAPPGPVLQLMAHRGITDELARLIQRLPLQGSVVEQAAATQQPLVWAAADEPAVVLRRYLDEAGVQTGISVPLLSKGTMVGAIMLGAASPRPISPEALSLLSAIGQQVGVAVENARLYEAEQSRREEAERRRQVAEGMREVLAVLNSRQSLQETLDFIAKQVCRLLDCGATAIWRLQDDLLRIQAACGLDAEYVTNMTLRSGVGGAGRALAEHRPIIIPNLEDEKLSGLSGGPFELLLKHYRSVLSVPLTIQGTDYGAMTLYYAAPREFSEEDLGLATSAAYQVALAIETARLREQAAQAAVLQERGRLARELHDSVTQSLYSVTMYTEAAARLVASGKEGAVEYLRDARDTAQEALREMRLLIYQLRPAALEQGGLADALQLRLDAVERRGGMRAELVVEGEDRLLPTTQAELHQVAQEALNNVLKHAHARAVRVHLHFGDAVTRLQVEDDGAGFDPATAPGGGGLGLPGMKERVEKLGGRLAIESAPGHGTKIVVEIPSGGGE